MAAWEKRAELAAMKHDAEKKKLNDAFMNGRQYSPLPDGNLAERYGAVSLMGCSEAAAGKGGGTL